MHVTDIYARNTSSETWIYCINWNLKKWQQHFLLGCKLYYVFWCKETHYFFYLGQDFFSLTFTLSYTLNIVKFCWMKGDNKWLFDRQNWSSVLNVASATVIFGAKSMATKMSVKILSAPNTPNPFGFRSIWCWTLHMLHSFWKITKLIFGLLWNKSDHLILNLMNRIIFILVSYLMDN